MTADWVDKAGKGPTESESDAPVQQQLSGW